MDIPVQRPFGRDNVIRRSQQSEKKKIFNARFVKENFGDRHSVLPNETFIKEWTFRNNGESNWP